MRFFTKTVVGITGLVSLSSVIADSPEVDAFRYRLANTDCAYLIANRAFGLQVMGWNFPVPAGYDFRGFQHLSNDDMLWFQKRSTVDPREYTQNHPGTSVGEAVRRTMEQAAEIYYYEEDEAENLENQEFKGFEPVEWKGLSLLFRATTGGHQQETTAYQAIVRTADQKDRLSITSTNIEQLTNIIACAEKAE